MRCLLPASTPFVPTKERQNTITMPRKGTIAIAVYGGISFGLFAASLVVLAMNSVDYLTMMYELTESVRLLILLNFVVSCFILMGFAGIKLIFRELRIIEIEHISEELPFYLINLLIIMFSDDNLLLNIVWINLTIMFKVFHIIMTDRLDSFQMKITNMIPHQISTSRQVFYNFATYRVLILLEVFTVADLLLAKFLAYDVFQGTRSVGSLLFGIHYGVLGMEAIAYFGKLVLNVYELMFYTIPNNQGSLSPGGNEVSNDEEISDEDEDPDDEDVSERVWENKPIYTQVFEIFVAGSKGGLYATFMYMLYVHGGVTPPITLLQGVAVSFLQVYSKSKKLRSFLEQSKKLDKALLNATKEDLHSGDNLCIICRDNMWCEDEYFEAKKKVLGARRRPKKLRCGHILHMGCLKDWMERSDNCPLCRTTVFATAAEAAQPGAGITHNEAEATPEAVVPERLRTEDSAPTPTSSASQRRPQEYSVPENAFIPEDWAAFPISAGSDSNTRNIRLSPESSGTITIRRRENGRNEGMDLFQITSSQ